MLPGRPPTQEEQDYLTDVASLGCIICLLFLNIKDSPAEIHHVDGKTKPDAHFKTIPLCARHHRIPGQGYVSRADGKKAFEEAYMPEEDLITVVIAGVQTLRNNTIGRRTNSPARSDQT